MRINYFINFFKNGAPIFTCNTYASTEDEAVCNCEFIPFYLGLEYDNIICEMGD